MSIVLTNQCCPFDWADEGVPELGTSPSDFIVERDGMPYLVMLEDREMFLDGTLTPETWHIEPRPLAIGDEIGFGYTESFGHFQYLLTPGPDGLGVKVLGDYPPHANLFGSPSDLIIEGTPEEAGREMAESGDFISTMAIWYWSDEVTYVVTVDPAGSFGFARKGPVQ
ncbi:hypothetical protein V6617_10280 [Pelagibacterium nitratireducens]|uniref:Uncharacterized protein n=1 Tax=Pelagibacterium nitratireducens TaxID=1046114 RepID=A0ABZ2HUX8_9HYPH